MRHRLEGELFANLEDFNIPPNSKQEFSHVKQTILISLSFSSISLVNHSYHIINHKISLHYVMFHSHRVAEVKVFVPEKMIKISSSINHQISSH